jgi:hypothetical protein
MFHVKSIFKFNLLSSHSSLVIATKLKITTDFMAAMLPKNYLKKSLCLEDILPHKFLGAYCEWHLCYFHLVHLP